MFKLLNPTAKIIIPMIVPRGGDIMNALGMTIFHAEAQTFFQQFCESLIQQRQNDKSGRQRDFLNIMCKFYLELKSNDFFQYKTKSTTKQPRQVLEA